MRYGFARLTGLGLLAIMLAGCTAQASDPRRHKGHRMTRLYTIDEETGEIMEAEKSDRSEGQTRPLIASPDGRTILVPSGLTGTILDWKSDDDAAEEMLVTIGTSRPPATPPDPPTVVYHVPAIPGVINLYAPIAFVDYGIGGMTETIVVDAFPEQKISLPASFVRVRVFNPGIADAHFFASVCRSRGNPHLGARYSETITIPATLSYSFNPPPYARSVKIVRALSPALTRGAIDVAWLNQFGLVKDSASYAALIDVPEQTLPGESSALRITNPDAVQPLAVNIVWFLEP